MKVSYNILLIVLALVSCNRINKLNEKPITIEARFMQYACGDWNDDMNIQSVTDSSYNFILGKDIDPEFLNGENEIRGWLYDNKSEKFGMTYKLTGFISSCAESGCDNGAPKFWITEITKLNGDEFDTSGEN
ncbi:hypothetical protein [uncultured Tenacibaculum sp.]|uniref:hypothetical protein n=1 Tax=uncultured Tenacibaculum sp. TaxID=174713 RepID=UPI0026102BD3|nr:hypothetical protein [uncultured Tenacibaculum sp.]